MYITGLFQGYTLNKNRFFAPSTSKRRQTPEVLHRKRPKIPKDLLKKIIPPIAKTSENQTQSFQYYSKTRVPSDTLSYLANRSSLASTPVPKNFRSNAATPFSRKEAKVRYKKSFKKSCDVAVQNESTESLRFHGIYYN